MAGKPIKRKNKKVKDKPVRISNEIREAMKDEEVSLEDFLQGLLVEANEIIAMRAVDEDEKDISSDFAQVVTIFRETREFIKFANSLESGKNKKEMFEKFKEFSRYLTEPAEIKLAIVLDPDVIGFMRNINLNKFSARSLDMSVSRIFVDPELDQTGAIANFIRRMTERGIPIDMDFAAFEKSAKECDLAVVGGEYSLPSEKELRERIYDLIYKGIPTVSLYNIDFSFGDGYAHLEDAVNTSPFKDGDMPFINGGVAVEKPFDQEEVEFLTQELDTSEGDLTMIFL